MKYKCYFEAQVWVFKKRNSSGAPSLVLFSLFYLYFLFYGLFGSFYLSIICHVWDLFMYPLLGYFIYLLFWDIFLTFRATPYVYTSMNKINTLLQGTHNRTETI